MLSVDRAAHADLAALLFLVACCAVIGLLSYVASRLPEAPASAPDPYAARDEAITLVLVGVCMLAAGAGGFLLRGHL